MYSLSSSKNKLLLSDGAGCDSQEQINFDFESLALEKYPSTHFKLQVLSCSGLKKADTFGASDPFLMISQGGDPLGISEVVPESMNPVFRAATFDIKYKHLWGKREVSDTNPPAALLINSLINNSISTPSQLLLNSFSTPSQLLLNSLSTQPTQFPVRKLTFT